MKNIYYLRFLIIAITIIASASTYTFAQASPEKEVFTAKVTTDKGDGFFRENVKIVFSKPVTKGIEHYRVIGRAQTEVKGNSDLIMALYYEPGLLAERVFLEDDKITLFFFRGIPDAMRLSNILSRVIRITHEHIAPTARLEVDNYDPLLGATLEKPSFKVPPPVSRRP